MDASGDVLDAFNAAVPYTRMQVDGDPAWSMRLSRATGPDARRGRVRSFLTGLRAPYRFLLVEAQGYIETEQTDMPYFAQVDGLYNVTDPLSRFFEKTIIVREFQLDMPAIGAAQLRSTYDRDAVTDALNQRAIEHADDEQLSGALRLAASVVYSPRPSDYEDVWLVGARQVLGETDASLLAHSIRIASGR